MSIGVVDIGMGNLGSLYHALDSQGWDILPVKTPDDMANLTHLLLPGVGAFATAMALLNKVGLIDPIHHFASNANHIMGICLGMQILAELGVEGGNTNGLAMIPGKVLPIDLQVGVRSSHVGWNESNQVRSHPILKNIRNDVDFYFVHSYIFVPADTSTVLAQTEYGVRFPSIIGKHNIVGTQFHPEKSQANGLRLLDNFCLWDGIC